MDIRRGDIFYVEKSDIQVAVGSEQHPGRPAVVVSNDQNNRFSRTVEVVYLTTAPKKDLPTHVVIRATSRESVAICEQIQTVSTDRLMNYIASCDEDEMADLENAMLLSLGIQTDFTDCEQTEDESNEDTSALEKALAEAKTENRMLKAMYDSLLEKMLRKEIA